VLASNRRMQNSYVQDAPEHGITPAQVVRVQSSFADVLPIADVAGMLFYERIFTLAPEARALFGDDIALQASRTMAAVKTAVDGLDDIDQVAPFLVRLGARHVRYGVVPAHFDLVGEAFLWTLEQGLGEAFTPEINEAWVAAFGVIARAMLIGMEQQSAKLEPAAV
jgi:hemoglobin-like flavoprotein